MQAWQLLGLQCQQGLSKLWTKHKIGLQVDGWYTCNSCALELPCSAGNPARGLLVVLVTAPTAAVVLATVTDCSNTARGLASVLQALPCEAETRNKHVTAGRSCKLPVIF